MILQPKMWQAVHWMAMLLLCGMQIEEQLLLYGQLPGPLLLTNFLFLRLEIPHDPQTFEVFYSDNQVTWVSAGGNHTGNAGATTTQTVSISTDGKAHQYWQWKVYNTFSQYQSFIFEAWLSFSSVLQSPVTQSYTLITSSGYDASTTQYPTLVFDGDVTTMWDANRGTASLVWSTAVPIVANQFSYVAVGDTTHDPQTFQVFYSDDSKTWVSAGGSKTGNPGVTTTQTFSISTDGKGHQYWQLQVSNTFSQYQAWILEAWLSYSTGGTNLMETHTNKPRKRLSQNVLAPKK